MTGDRGGSTECTDHRFWLVLRALLLLLAMALAAVGCSSGEDEGRTDTEFPAEAAAEAPADSSASLPPPPPPAPPPPSPTTHPSGRESAAPSNQEAMPVEPPVAPAPATQRPPTRAVAKADVLSIELSAGVALPQTTPAGTVMSFSVDYRFVRGRPDPSTQYVWVIERANGPPGMLPARLTAEGTLRVFVQEWRSRHGPFRARIEDRRGNRLSASVPLR